MRIQRIILLFALCACIVAAHAESDDLCMDGTLLFREDFGGNDPNDPIVGDQQVEGMDYSRYTQRTNADHVIGQPGLFWLIKSGYYHADTTGGKDPMKNHSNWYLQDDHTYPGDKTRGYFLEIDGLGGKASFYTKVIRDVCPGSQLTFSAYVANVNKASNYIDGVHARVYPRLLFELENAYDGTILTSHSTGDIPYDADLANPTDFQYSSKWYLHGMNFVVPEGVDSIRLTIYNDVENNGAGNDFALDDIEIRLCAPPISISGPDEVCHGSDLTLQADFTNDGTFTYPRYKWFHSRDSINWDEIPQASTFAATLPLPHIQWGDSGWFKVAVASYGQIDRPNCRAESQPFYLHVVDCPSDLCTDGTLLFREDFGGNDPNDPDVSMASVPGMDPSYHNSGNSLWAGNYTLRKEGWKNGIQWHRQDDHTHPNDKTRGYLLEVDGMGGETPFYSKTIEGLCAGSTLSFSAYVVNVHHVGQIQWFFDEDRSYVYPRMKFVLKNPNTGEELASKSTGDIRPDYAYLGRWKEARENDLSAEWQLVGMNFTIPDGIESIQMFIYNDVAQNGTGNDFALDDIEIRLCLPPVTIEGESEVCEGSMATLTAHFTNDGTLAEPLEYKWWFSSDSLTWTEVEMVTGDELRVTGVQKAESGWYKVAVAGTGNIESVNCRAMSEPFHLRVEDCPPPISDLCMDGTLLFREDFGGNDPNDPRVVTTPTPVPGMKYAQLLDDTFGAMRSGVYLLTKQGYCNGDTLPTNPYRGSQWHLQDDHTYPDDVTRGYMMEIDGRGDNAAFYQKTIDGLCEGSQLTFSAYVANVMTWGQYEGSPGKFAYPRMKFVLTNPLDNTELASYDTGDIPFDSAFIGDYKCWMYSSKWHLVGMNFTVPEGLNSVTLTIYNNATGTIGNDFALDDIEVRLCLPRPEITSDNKACLDSTYTFAVDFTNDGTLAEPLEYKWWYSQDSLIWVETPDFIGKNPELSAVQKADSGWYQVAVSGAGNIESVNCRTISEPFHLTTKECEDPSPYRHVFCDTTVCHEDSILYRGKNYAAPGTYIDTIHYPTAKDTIYHLNITDSRSFHDVSIIITAGNPPPHPWETITEAGIYYDTLVNALGCDSIVTWYISFKERCIESLEEHLSFCAGYTLIWHGREYSRPGDYRDTLWHSMPEACDTAALLHLRMLPVFMDTTFATIHYGDEYTWEGNEWSEPTTQTRQYIAANGCDSLVTLQLTIDYSLTVEQMELESGCSEEEQMTLHLQLSRLVDSVRITFSDDAQKAGLRDSIVYFHSKQGDIVIPHRSARPGRFTCEIALMHDGAVLYASNLSFTLLYPASVLEQAWNDVVAVLTHDYNGGYDFVAFQWYENGEPLTGENHSYLYRPLVMGGEYSALLTEPDGRQSMTCPLIATHHEDISLYPTVVGPRRMLRCHVPQQAEILLYDALGRVVLHDVLPAGETQLQAPGTTGVYIAAIILRNNPKPQLYKLIVR